ncbi:MAG: putative bifunctional diguanylate cyclase/phosphodiesterase [Chitinivibrionales bacterium]
MNDMKKTKQELIEELTLLRQKNSGNGNGKTGEKLVDTLRIADILLKYSHEGIVITDAQGIIQKANREFRAISGFSETELLGQKTNVQRSDRHPSEFYEQMWQEILQRGYWRGKVWNRRRNGQIYMAHLTVSAVKDECGTITHYVGFLDDISRYSHDFQEQTYYDVLTGLPNRALLNDRLDFMLAHARRNGQILAVLFMDLDRFKVANDSLGYAGGDQLLQMVARRLKKTVREVDAVFRLGNDEFAIILEEISHIEDAAKVAKKIQNLFTQSFALPSFKHEVFISASIGISLFPYDGVDMETLVKNAESAMHRAKEQGENNYQHYTPSMNSKALEHITIEYRLHKALEQDEFLVYYQPQIDLQTGRVVGAEALVRWKHPELGLVSPGEFIPIAEETGLILPIGEWVLATATKQTQLWHQQGFDPLRIAVNLSARQFQQHDMVERVLKTLDQSSLDPNFLELEITESLGMKNAALTVKTLTRLKKMGIHISIDDFGTGYSSLNYLKRFPVDTLKIDQSFIRDISLDQGDEAIVSIIIDMAHALGLKVIAEGVENEIQLGFLKGRSCDQVQGYFFSPPIPAQAFEQYLMKHRK